ncbi:MAG TPA: tRNA (guanosine(46)-N7)-methyltransferase TrmB [Candidatus Chromulinivoraceae bacterium]|nr:tRNA (guanosine(46)-N7)-methyltransferase TrmB [Candidatus Chromulinivoraceae bacterium]
MTIGTSDKELLNPADYMITRKRKQYRFALFHNSPLCFEYDEWDETYIPQVAEIGAGTGLFSVAQAAAHPEGKFLAVDVKADRLQKGAYAATEKHLDNLRFLRVRADQLPEKIAAHSLDILWVTFPDPFPRKHSAGRRLTHPHFLKFYAGLLKSDGALYFKTDAKKLFEWSLEQLVAEGWKVEELSFDLHDSNLADWYKIKTTYEARFVDEGLLIGFVKATPPKV